MLDYILDDLTAQNPPIPRQTWDATLEHADSRDLMSVGYQGAVEHGQLDVAETAWRRSAARGNPGAMSNLGVLLKERGETTEAEQWYRKAAALKVEPSS